MKQNFGCSERTTKQKKNIIIQNEEQRKNYNEKRKNRKVKNKQKESKK